MVSETTAAATGQVGVPRNDPMSMLPFCGYNMADYFAHWLQIGQRLTRPPGIFHVNWFRTDDDGKLLWPGFGQNVRVLQWIVDRARGAGRARDTVIGAVRTDDGIDLAGLGLSPRKVAQLLAVDAEAWWEEAKNHQAFFERFGARMPEALWRENRTLFQRVAEELDVTSAKSALP
jgi:phosphoenolpyruvate carboxykinase (GTP)